MARYVAKPEIWFELPEERGTLQNIGNGVIEVSTERTYNTGLKLSSNQLLSFSGQVYIRSVGNADCAFTTVPFETSGEGGDVNVEILLTKDTLWTGAAFEKDSIIELSGNIEDYDELNVVLGLTSNNAVYVTNSCFVGTNPSIYVSWLNNDFSGGYVARLDIVSDNEVKLVESSRLNEDVAIIGIYGIRYVRPNYATEKRAGLVRLYKSLGNGEDGTMTQRAIKDEMENLFNRCKEYIEGRVK